MNRISVPIIACVVAFLMCSMAGISQAQEQEEEMEYTYGTVVSVSAKEIVVSEYDYEEDKEVNVTYAIDPKAKIEGAESAADIAVGDIVEMDYMVEGNKNVAKNIFVEKPSDIEEYEIDEMEEEYDSSESYD